MFKAGFDNRESLFGSASGRCGLDAGDNGWRWSWRRITPPAVPCVSVRNRDS